LARSNWKFNYITTSLYKNIFLNKFKSIKVVKLFCRGSSIPKFLLKKTATLYKGNLFVRILFTKYHIGFKTGEFGVTRKPFNFPLKNKNKKR
jgi:ribosomal protein S19